MKNKIINIVIVFFLILVLLIDVVQALTMNFGIEYTVNSKELEAKIKIKGLKIDENKINSISFNLGFDNKALEVKTVENLNGWTSTYTEHNNKITLIKLSGTSEDEEICVIKFNIKDESKLNNTEIRVIEGVVSDGETEKDISDIGIKIKTEEETENINTNTNTNTNTNINQNTNANTNTNQNKNTNTNQNTNTNVNKNKNTNINQNKNTNKNVLNNKKNNTNNESKVQIDNKSDNTISTNKIPYAGFKTYIRIAMLIILTVAISVYVKYKNIDKIC